MGFVLVAVVGASVEFLNLTLMTSNPSCYRNVLKLRKEEREKASTSNNAAEDLHSPSQRPRSLHPVTQAQQSINGFMCEDEASRKSSRSTSPAHRGKRKSKELTAKERYLRRWRAAVGFGTHSYCIISNHPPQRRDEQDPTPFLVSTEEGNAKLKGAQRKPSGKQLYYPQLT